MRKCMFGKTPACKACVDSNCVSDFKACSGIAPPSVAFQVPATIESSACINDTDRKALTSKGQPGIEADLTACGHSSWGDEAKATTCMKQKEAVSDGCASCFGSLIHCSASKCMSKCMFGKTPACKACVDSNCVNDFKACSGIAPPSVAFQFPAATESSACINDADKKALTSKGQPGIEADLTTCGRSSWGDE